MEESNSQNSPASAQAPEGQQEQMAQQDNNTNTNNDNKNNEKSKNEAPQTDEPWQKMAEMGQVGRAAVGAMVKKGVGVVGNRMEQRGAQINSFIQGATTAVKDSLSK